MPAGRHLYFAYGSNLCVRQMALRCPDAVDPRPAVLSDHDWLINQRGVATVEPFVGTQVHGTHLRAIAPDAPPSAFADANVRWPVGDGLIAGEPGVGVGVFVADCLPVLLWRRDRPLVAAVHAGWRGLVAGIVEDAVAALGDPARTGAAIGPGIGPCCYPVSAEVRDRFAGRFGTTCLVGQAVDLAVAGRAALAHAGVPSSGIWVMGACTSCEPKRWFSYRRDGAPTGRQAGIIWVEG